MVDADGVARLDHLLVGLDHPLGRQGGAALVLKGKTTKGGRAVGARHACVGVGKGMGSLDHLLLFVILNHPLGRQGGAALVLKDNTTKGEGRLALGMLVLGFLSREAHLLIYIYIYINSPNPTGGRGDEPRVNPRRPWGRGWRAR